MKSFRSAVLLLAALLVAGTAFAQGRGRIEGRIVNEQGQPVAGVVVQAQKVGSPDETSAAKSNEKGEFSLPKVTNGEWRVEFRYEGLQVPPATVEVANNRAPALTITMAAPPPDPMVFINSELKRAAELMQAGNLAEARTIYEALHAKYPQPFQFPFAIATTYAAEKNYDKALEYAKVAEGLEPTSVDVKLLVSEIYMDTDRRPEAIALLESIDLEEVQDPVLFLNAGIILINDQKSDDAVRMFDRLLERFPDNHSIYYYRGRAKLAGQKLPDAKADLEKFISLAPAESKEVADAKKIIAEIDQTLAAQKKEGK